MINNFLFSIIMFFFFTKNHIFLISTKACNGDYQEKVKTTFRYDRSYLWTKIRLKKGELPEDILGFAVVDDVCWEIRIATD